VKALASKRGLPVEQPASLRGPGQALALAAWGLDVLVVAAYGLILPPAVLAVPRYGCVNVHASLLPRWRGAAPVERAIMAGDSETGICIMAMERGLDTGPIYLSRGPVPIEPDTDGPGLEARLVDLGGSALVEVLAQLPALQPVPQSDEGVTYAGKLTRADAEIDWQRPALDIHRQVRALKGRMPAFTFLGTARLSVLEADVESGAGAAPGTLISADNAGIRIGCGTGRLNVRRLKLSVGKGGPDKNQYKTANLLISHLVSCLFNVY
jgi:methionyl-tRNA formyltransferase